MFQALSESESAGASTLLSVEYIRVVDEVRKMIPYGQSEMKNKRSQTIASFNNIIIIEDSRIKKTKGQPVSNSVFSTTSH